MVVREISQGVLQHIGCLREQLACCFSLNHYVPSFLKFVASFTYRFCYVVFVAMQQELEGKDKSGPPGFGQSTRTYVWWAIDWNVCLVAGAPVFSGMFANMLCVRFGRSSWMSNDRSGTCTQLFAKGTINSRKCFHHTTPFSGNNPIQPSNQTRNQAISFL